jgi:FKBP-type peptidyl-prolyl cis-trans isomerase FklB
MKRIITAAAFSALVGLSIAQVSAQQPAGAPPATQPAAGGAAGFPDLKTKISYIIGQNMGRQMARDKMELDMTTFMAGMKDGIAGTKSALSDAEMQAAIAEFTEAQQVKQNAAKAAQGDKNKAEGAAFLAANGKKEGVTTLPSGVQYKVLKAGTGVTPKLTDSVTTHYKGTLLDGSTFDSSYERGQPATFPVNGVIAGWTEVLQKMKVGDKWEIYVPGDKAYGPRGTPDGSIGPNAVLTFEIELIAVDGQ